MKFEPSVNTGQIIQIVAIIVSVTMAYGRLSANDDAQARETDNIKVMAAAESARTKETLDKIQVEQKDQTRLLNELNTAVALLRGRAAETVGGSKR